MHTRRSFTNTTFTKRVDHDGGRHRPARAMKEPAVCGDCKAIYLNRRWTKSSSALEVKHISAPQMRRKTICPACVQKKTGEPRGFVFIDGRFFLRHRKEVEQLLRNEALRAGEDNPLARILRFKCADGHKLTVSTTTEHLAQRLGHALEKAFGGVVDYNFSHENKLARVSWRRE